MYVHALEYVCAYLDSSESRVDTTAYEGSKIYTVTCAFCLTIPCRLGRMVLPSGFSRLGMCLL